MSLFLQIHYNNIIVATFACSCVVSKGNNVVGCSGPYSIPYSGWGKIFVVFVVEHWTTNISPMNEATLPTFTCSASSHHEYLNHKLNE